MNLERIVVIGRAAPRHPDWHYADAPAYTAQLHELVHDLVERQSTRAEFFQANENQIISIAVTV